MTMIKQLLKAKGRSYVSVSPSETVYSAIEKMAQKEYRVGARYGRGNARGYLH